MATDAASGTAASTAASAIHGGADGFSNFRPAVQQGPSPARRPRDLVGRVALVTGATSGLGMETAVQLAERGAKVIFGVRNPAKAERVVAAIRKRYTHDSTPRGSPSIRPAPSPSSEQPPSLEFVLPPAIPPLDLSDSASISRFARALLADVSTPLHILVNNAGTSMLSEGPVVNDWGVNSLVQVNYLGPYTLTRLLEPKLVSNGARVVGLSSVTHRCYEVPDDPRVFLHSTSRMTYAWTKVAMVLFAYELQRRWGPLGVQSCAVDPGGVRTAIWDEVPALAAPPAKWVIEGLYAPASDGAAVVVTAATRPWAQDLSPAVLSPSADLRYYARGAMASPLVALVDGAWRSLTAIVKPALFGTSVVLHSLVDYPVRHWTGGRMFNQTVPVRSAQQTYDSHLSAALWSYSEKVAGLTGAGGGMTISAPPQPLPTEAAGTSVVSGVGGTGTRTSTLLAEAGIGVAAENGEEGSPRTAPNRKRPVMSPMQTFMNLAPLPPLPHDNPTPPSQPRATAAPPNLSISVNGAGIDGIDAVALASASANPASARRRLIARRDSDADELDASTAGEGAEASGGGGVAVAVAVPAPPERMQTVATEHGVVLPGPAAAGGAAAAAGDGGDVGFVRKSPLLPTGPTPTFDAAVVVNDVSPREVAPPPSKRLHTGVAGDVATELVAATAGGDAVAELVLERGGGGGGADSKGPRTGTAPATAESPDSPKAAAVAAPPPVTAPSGQSAASPATSAPSAAPPSIPAQAPASQVVKKGPTAPAGNGAAAGKVVSGPARGGGSGGTSQVEPAVAAPVVGLQPDAGVAARDAVRAVADVAGAAKSSGAGAGPGMGQAKQAQSRGGSGGGGGSSPGGRSSGVTGAGGRGGGKGASKGRGAKPQR